MNITPLIKYPFAQLRSTRNRNNLIVNVSIQIPLKTKIPTTHRSQQTSVTPSPNKLKKRYKLISHATQTKNHSTTPNIARDAIQHEQTQTKKKSNIVALASSAKGLPAKLKSMQLSPKKRSCQASRRAKDTARLAKNLTILQQVLNDDDNIIKYTTNSYELKQRPEEPSSKIPTVISDVDINEIRTLENQASENKERYYLSKMNEFTRNACAKKIQRAWRNYKTKKLIRSYSNDSRNKSRRRMHIAGDPVLTVRSQGGMTFKKKLVGFQETSSKKEVEQEASKAVKKIQEDNMEKWQGLLQQIKNTKSRQAQQLPVAKGNLQSKIFEKGFFGNGAKEALQANPTKIIKTKTYYETERQKWRETRERITQPKQQRINYFSNEMHRLQNDDSDCDSSVVSSIGEEHIKKQQEIQNLKLRKKLQIFKSHLPQRNTRQFNTSVKQQEQSNKMEIAIVAKGKAEIEKKQQVEKKQVEEKLAFQSTPISIQIVDFDYQQDRQFTSRGINQKPLDSEHKFKRYSQLSQPLTTRKNRLKQVMIVNQPYMNQLFLEELIMQTLIEASQSETLTTCFKSLHNRKQNQVKKAEGIVTNHSSIKDYLNYFIDYIRQFDKQAEINRNLLVATGPSPQDVLKYFRGKEISYNPDQQYIMSIQLFNQHWQHANEVIYFDKVLEDEQQQAARVDYLKKLTKIFYRAIFDCLNQSLERLRIYGIRGRPYPWSKNRLELAVPKQNRPIQKAVQRVLDYSLVFAGLHFDERRQSIDPITKSQILEANLSKLIVLEIKDDEPLWLDFEDYLVELKLKLAEYLEDILLNELTKILSKGP